jgi:hypothetical protein
MHAVKHLLTPGTQGYALLKMGALASVFGLQWSVRRRGRTPAAEPEATAAPSPRRDPHPRSKKKKRKRRP